MGNAVSPSVIDLMEEHVHGWLEANGGNWNNAYKQHNIDTRIGGRWAMILQVEVDTYDPTQVKCDRAFTTRSSFVHLDEIRSAQGNGDVVAFGESGEFPPFVLSEDMLVSLVDELETCMKDHAVVAVQLCKKTPEKKPDATGPASVFQCSDIK